MNSRSTLTSRVRQPGPATRHSSLDERIEQFEKAWHEGNRSIEAYLPDRQDPTYEATLVELVRVDLELRWNSGERMTVAEYQARYRDVLQDPAHLAAVAFEEYRLRRASGESCSREAYASEYGIDVTDWPELPVGEVSESEAADAQAMDELASVDGKLAGRLARARRQLPEVGDWFLDFELVGELGRGAFGRTYLARQGDLANRFVALKITAQLSDEPQRLAQLQHTNIVPIYSWHQHGALQAVCMPFLGPNTLADVLKSFRASRALPDSGQALVSTMMGRRGSTAVRRAAGELNTDQCVESPSDGSPNEGLRRLSRMSYIEASTWIMARIADGLTHAHEHGLLHRDLKPANILLTDDGEPLILDFNLATSTNANDSVTAYVGGTLPYMAPEQIKSFQEGGDVGASADIYSLGTILFEMITGQLPYPIRRGSFDDVLQMTWEDRQAPAPSVREFNRAASRDLETIVAKCLAVNPADRYQSARDLRTDLLRHSDNRPLRHAPNRSFVERLRKWARRHPHLTSNMSIAAIATMVVVVLLAGWITRGRMLQRQEADRQAAWFVEHVTEARTALNLPGVDDITLSRVIHEAESVAGLFALGTEELLEKQHAYALLSHSRQQQVRDRAAEWFYLIAAGRAAMAVRANSPAERKRLLTSALATNQQLDRFSVPGQQPAAYLLQRARLLDAMGKKEQADRLRKTASSAPKITSFDQHSWAAELLHRRDNAAAVSTLESLVRNRPQDYSAWFGLGSAHFQSGNYAKAEMCYTACVGLRPTLTIGWLMRGVARLKQQQHEDACGDFDHALKQQPVFPAALVNRALARRGMGDTAGAVRDLSEALAQGAGETRIYFMRARFRQELGDREGAEADRKEGLRRTPKDEESWVARGVARLATDPQGALQDFEAALKLNPRSPLALQNAAHVLADRLGRPDAALDLLDRLAATSPDSPLIRVNRAVMLARLGRAESAISEAEWALQKDASPPVLYRGACVFALLQHPDHPEYRSRALELLKQTLQRDPAWIGTAVSDPDVESLRDDPAYRRIAEAALTLQQPFDASPTTP